MAGASVHGGALRMLTVPDEHTREIHVLGSELPIGLPSVIKLVQTAIPQHGALKFSVPTTEQSLSPTISSAGRPITAHQDNLHYARQSQSKRVCGALPLPSEMSASTTSNFGRRPSLASSSRVSARITKPPRNTAHSASRPHGVSLLPPGAGDCKSAPSPHINQPSRLTLSLVQIQQPFQQIVEGDSNLAG